MSPGPSPMLADWISLGAYCQLRTFYNDEGGTTWVCATCEQSYWVPVADVPYDQNEASA